MTGEDGDLLEALRSRGLDLPPPPDAESPQGRWRVVGELGRGGIGIVHRVEDVALGRTVALKSLRPRLAGRRDALQRFVNEAQVASQLQHAGIIAVYDVGVDEHGAPYYTMQCVRGATLAERITDHGVPRRRLLSWLERAAEALAHAHACGVVHRDVKPANVMVGEFGEVRVLDWGFAKIIARGPETPDERPAGPSPRPTGESDSRSGSVMGTPAYMPPEQARGEIERIDERVDVFALGAVLCEILTGAPPYAGESDGALERARAGDTRIDWQGRDDRLARLSRRCMDAEPAGRPRDAGVFLRLLREALAEVDERGHRARLRSLAEKESCARAAAEAAALEAEARADRSRGVAEEEATRGASRRRERAASLAREVRAGRLWTTAAALGVLLALAAGGTLWALRVRDAADRRARAEAEVESSLAEAGRLEADGRFPEALAAARHALALSPRARATVAGLERRQAEAETIARRREHAGQLEREVDAARRRGDPRATERAIAEAAGRRGLDPGAFDLPRAADLLGPQAAAAFLDRWVRFRHLNRALLRPTDRSLGALLAGAAELDPEPDRRRVRKALTDADPHRLAALAEHLDVDDVGASIVGLVATVLAEHGDTQHAAALLSRAFLQRPGAEEVLHEQAWVLLHTGHAAEAARFAWARALRAHDRAQPWIDLGEIQRARGRIESALACAGRALDRDADNPYLLQRMTMFLVEARRHGAALKTIRKAVSLAPDVAALHARLATVLLWLDQDVEGGREAARAVASAPELPEAHEVLAWSLQRRGRPAEALRHAIRAVTLDERFAEGWRRRSMLEARMGDVQAALASAERARSLAPDSPFTSVLLAFVREVAHLPGARAAARDAVRLMPLLASQVLENRVVALSQRGEWAEAKPLAERYTRLAPKSAAGWLHLGLVLQTVGDDAGALDAFRQAVAVDPGCGSARYEIALRLLFAGKRKEARAGFHEALRVSPWLYRAHYCLGLMDHQRDPAAAEAEYRAAIALAPGDVDSHINLANLLAGAGKMDAALRHYRLAIRADPDGVEARWDMAMALMRLGDLEGCARLYDEIAKRKPDMDGLQANRQAVVQARGVLSGGTQDGDEAGLLAGLFQRAQAFLLSDQLYEAFEKARPQAFADFTKAWRYNAACAALRAAGEPFTAPEQDAALLRRAHAWLAAEIDACATMRDGDDEARREAARQRLQLFAQDPDLAGVRAPAEARWRRLFERAERLRHGMR